MFGFSVSRAAKDYGWALALVCTFAALIFATYVRPVAPVVDPLVGLFRSPAEVVCPSTWTETAGTEPDTRLSFKTCTSPEQRYILTFRQGQAPVGLDTVARTFMSAEDIGWFLK